MAWGNLVELFPVKLRAPTFAQNDPGVQFAFAYGTKVSTHKVFQGTRKAMNLQMFMPADLRSRLFWL